MAGQAKKRLGELLIEAGVIDEGQLAAALAYHRQWGVRLGQALVDLKFSSEADVVQVLARRFGFEVARLDQLDGYGHQQALQLVGREFAVRHNVFPLGADTSTLSVAMSDPTNLAVVDELRFRTGRRVKVAIAGDREISSGVKDAYPSPEGGGAVDAIALELDVDVEGEAVMATFGGGSEDAMHAFYASAPASAPAPTAPEVPAPSPAPQVQPGALRGAPAAPAAQVAPGASRPAVARPTGQPVVRPPLPRPPTPADPRLPARPPAAPGGGVARAEPEREELIPLEEEASPAPAPAARPAVPAPAARPAAPAPAAVRAAPAPAPGRPTAAAERAAVEALAELLGDSRGSVARGSMVALVGLARLLLRKGLVTEAELLAALRGE